MSATLTLDRKKYVRLANRIVLKAIESEEEYDRMVAAVEQLMNKGEDRLSPEESALLETMAILVEAHDDRHYPLPPRPPHEMRGYRGTPFRGGIPGKGRRNCSGTMAPMTNRIHSFDRVPLFERQGFWGLGQWRRNLHKVSPPHPLFQRAPVPRRWSPESSTAWVERTDWSASSSRLPLDVRKSRRGLILPSL